MERSLTRAWRWEDFLKIMHLLLICPKTGKWPPILCKFSSDDKLFSNGCQELPAVLHHRLLHCLPHMLLQRWSAIHGLQCKCGDIKKHWLSFLGTWSTRVLRPSRVRAWVRRWSLPCYRYWLCGIPHSWYQSVQSYDEDCKNGFLGWVLS